MEWKLYYLKALFKQMGLFYSTEPFTWEELEDYEVLSIISTDETFGLFPNRIIPKP